MSLLFSIVIKAGLCGIGIILPFWLFYGIIQPIYLWSIILIIPAWLYWIRWRYRFLSWIRITRSVLANYTKLLNIFVVKIVKSYRLICFIKFPCSSLSAFTSSWYHPLPIICHKSNSFNWLLKVKRIITHWNLQKLFSWK